MRRGERWRREVVEAAYRDWRQSQVPGYVPTEYQCFAAGAQWAEHQAAADHERLATLLIAVRAVFMQDGGLHLHGRTLTIKNPRNPARLLDSLATLADVASVVDAHSAAPGSVEAAE